MVSCIFGRGEFFYYHEHLASTLILTAWMPVESSTIDVYFDYCLYIYSASSTLSYGSVTRCDSSLWGGWMIFFFDC